MFKYPTIYKTVNNIIEKEEVIANPWYCITTKDANGNYHSYNINDVDNDQEVFTHILLAYQFLKQKGVLVY